MEDLSKETIKVLLEPIRSELKRLERLLDRDAWCSEDDPIRDEWNRNADRWYSLNEAMEKFNRATRAQDYRRTTFTL